MMQEMGMIAEAPPDGVNLLVSMLVRYPEISSLAYEPKNNVLTLKFIISPIEDKEAIFLKIDLLEESLAAFYGLMKLRPLLAKISIAIEDKLAVLSIERDVATITRNEVVLLVTLLREQMQGLLLSDLPSEQSGEDNGFQEELIENMLKSIESNYHGQGLLGIREEGRVLVFNK